MGKLTTGTSLEGSSWSLKWDPGPRWGFCLLRCVSFDAAGPRRPGGVGPIVLGAAQAANGKRNAGGGKEEEGWIRVERPCGWEIPLSPDAYEIQGLPCIIPETGGWHVSLQ